MKPQPRFSAFLILIALLFPLRAFATNTIVCDTSCGGTSPSDSTLIAARSSPSAARGVGTIINPVLKVPRSVAVVGSQSFTYGVPIFAFAGRAGMDMNLGLSYNSFIWTAGGFNGNQLVLNADFDQPSVGFRLDYGWMDFSDDGSAGVLTDGSGVKHPIGIVNISPTQNGYRTTDGSDVRIQDGANGTKLAVYKSGLVVSYTLINPAGFTSSYRPVLLEDANGNTISITYQNTTSTAIKTVTDSVGRQINFFYDASSLLSCVTTASNCSAPSDLSPAGPSASLTYKFDWNPNYVLKFNFARSTGTLTSGTSTLPVLTGVTRPDGTSVKFDYGDWGIVNAVRELSANGTLRASVSYNFPAASDGALNDNPGYTQETVFDGVNTGLWRFDVTRDATTHAVTSFAVTDPSGVMSSQTIGSDGLPTQAVTKAAPCTPAGCTTPQFTVNTTYTLDGMRIPRLTAITSILEDGQTQSLTQIGYDSDGNTADVKVYDNGVSAPGPLLKETVISYRVIGNATRTADVQVKNGSGTVVFHRTMNYDEGTLTTESPNPAGHDAAFASTTRGNLTSTTIYADPRANTGAVTTTLTYDNLGNALTQQDGCCTFFQNSYSAATQFAYLDSILIGPPSKQIRFANVAYNLGTGTIASVTDVNGAITRYSYDTDGRLRTSTTPDGVITTQNYDDNGAIPSASLSSTANSVVKTISYGAFGVLSTILSNGPLTQSSTISTQSNTYDAVGRLLSATSPYGPGELPTSTLYGYDPFNRPASITPPATGASGQQNPYLTAYSLSTITTTDPALKLRRETMDALGRIVRVDEPGLLGGSAANGSVTVSGTEKSVATSSGNGATAGTAQVTITPSTASDRSTQVLTHAATKASGTVTISGVEGSETTDPCADQGGTFGPGGGLSSCPRTVYDIGSVTVTINGISKTASYGQSSTSSTIAANLAGQFGSNSVFAVTVSNNVLTVTAQATGTGGNSITLAGGNFGDFSATPSGATLGGGTNDGFTTFYDTGNVTVRITTTGGSVYSKSVAYGQSSSGSTLAAALASAFNSDPATNSVVISTASNNVLSLTTTATGSATNYALATSAATNSQYFAANTTSFTPAAPATFTAGANGTLFDSGTIEASIAGYTSSPYKESVAFGQGSTAQSVATSVAGAFHNDPFSPVDATVASGTSTITFTARTTGTEANSYSFTIREVSSQSSSFPTPSFPTVSVSLAGGTPATPSLDPSVALSTFYTFDPEGNMTGVTQGQQTRSYNYDGLGRLTSASVPEMGNQPVTYTYKDFGGVDQKIDPRVIPGTSTHLTTTYGYDDYNRLQSVTFNDGTPGMTYTYGAPAAANNTGWRITNVTSAPAAPNAGLSASEDYQYDVMGRLKQCVNSLQPIGSTLPAGTFTTGYSYFADGQTASVTYPSGRVVSNAVDAIGRLTHVDNNGVALLQIGSNYNAAGLVTGATFGNQVQATFGYNKQLQLTSLRYATTAGALLDLGYDYGDSNDNGQINSIADHRTPSHGVSYVYDELKRLQTAQTSDLTAADSWKLRFTYDRYGNRLRQIQLGGNAQIPNANGDVNPATNRLSLPGVTYDAAGNMTGDNLHTYTFDANNHVTKVDGVNNSYAYGPNGLRVLKNNVYYIYSGDHVIAEYVAGSPVTSPRAEYLYHGGHLLATIDSTGLTYHYPDHLSTRVSADSTATATRSYGSLPFGGTWYETGVASKWKFATYEHDSESGLDYAQARLDSTFFGRFTSVDPLTGNATDPQSLNRYSYTQNDPVNMADPSGMAGGNWTCLLDNFGNCVGGNYNGAGLFATAGMSLWPSPFGPMTDPTKWNPLAEGEARYDEQVKAAFAANNAAGSAAQAGQGVGSLAAAMALLSGKTFIGGFGMNMLGIVDDDHSPTAGDDQGGTPVYAYCEDGKCVSSETVVVYADGKAPDPPFNIKDNAPSNGNLLPNGDVPIENDFIHCKECGILRETSRTAANPCTYIAWAAAAAPLGWARVAGTAEASAALRKEALEALTTFAENHWGKTTLAAFVIGVGKVFDIDPIGDATTWVKQKVGHALKSACDKMQ